MALWVWRNWRWWSVFLSGFPSCHIFLFSFFPLYYKDRDTEKELVIVDKEYALSFLLLQFTANLKIVSYVCSVLYERSWVCSKNKAKLYMHLLQFSLIFKKCYKIQSFSQSKVSFSKLSLIFANAPSQLPWQFLEFSTFLCRSIQTLSRSSALKH